MTTEDTKPDWFAIWDSANTVWNALPQYRYFRPVEDTLGEVQQRIFSDWLAAEPKQATFFEWDQAQDGGDYDEEQQGRFLEAWKDDAEVVAAATALFALYEEQGSDPDGEATIAFYELLQTRGHNSYQDGR